MSTGKIEVWVLELENLCSVSQRVWTVCLLDCCSLKPVEFCGVVQCAQTKCGTVEFEVPPGRYILLARSLFELAFGEATVSCGQQVCITLVSVHLFFKLATEEQRRYFMEELEKMKPTGSQQPPTA